MSDLGSRCAVLNLHRTLAVHPNRVEEHLQQLMVQHEEGGVGTSNVEQKNPFWLATAKFLTANHQQPVEELRMTAAEVFARFVNQARSPPTADMIAAFDNCMDAASVVGRFKFMIGYVHGHLLEVSHAEATDGQPKTLTSFPPISDKEFEDAQDEAYAASVGGNTLPPPARVAFSLGDMAAILRWLDAGGPVDARIPYNGHGHARGATMLIIAAGPLGRQRDAEGIWDGEWDGIRKDFVEMLLRRGASVELQDSTGTSALMMAASYGQRAIVRLLLEAGAKIGLRDRDGETASKMAERHGHSACVGAIREHLVAVAGGGQRSSPMPHTPPAATERATVSTKVDDEYASDDVSDEPSDGPVPIHVHIKAKAFERAQQTARETGVSLEEVLAKMVADGVRFSRTGLKRSPRPDADGNFRDENGNPVAPVPPWIAPVASTSTAPQRFPRPDANGDLRDSNGDFAAWRDRAPSLDAPELPEGEVEGQLARHPHCSRDASKALLDVHIEIVSRMNQRREADYEPEAYEKLVTSDLQQIKAALREHEPAAIPGAVQQGKNLRNHLKRIVARVRKELKEDAQLFAATLRETQEEEDLRQTAAAAKVEAKAAAAAAAKASAAAAATAAAAAAAKAEAAADKAAVETATHKKARRKKGKARGSEGQVGIVAQYAYDADGLGPAADGGANGGDAEGPATPRTLTDALADVSLGEASCGAVKDEDEVSSGTVEDEEPPEDYLCPITHEVMVDPVMATDGHTYERRAIERWLQDKCTSPNTGEALELKAVFPNHLLRRQIREWQERVLASVQSVKAQRGEKYV
jgi:hypothetical protein